MKRIAVAGVVSGGMASSLFMVSYSAKGLEEAVILVTLLV
jgi:hypothetical protein